MPPRAQLYEPTLDVAPKGPRDPSELVHINVPEVQYTGAVGKSMEIAGHMTEMVGRAQGFLAGNLDRLGNQFERAGDEIFNRAVGLQELTNQTEAKKASIEYDTWAGQKQVEFGQKQGEAADATSLKAHMEELQKKRDELSNKMTNPSMKRHFDDHTLSSMGNKFTVAAAHAASETRKAATGASDARIKMNSDMFSKTDDIQESQRILERTYKEHYGTLAPLNGWTKDQADEKWNETVTKMNGSKINRIADQDGKKAMDMLNDPDNKKYFTADAYTKLLHDVKEKWDRQRARNIGDDVQKTMEDSTLEEKLEKTDKMSEEQAPGDKDLRDASRKETISRHSVEGREKREQHTRDLGAAKDAAYGYRNPDGSKPWNREQFMAIPGAKEAWDRLNGKDREDIQRILDTNAKGDYPATRATELRVKELKDMSTSEDPELREKFKYHKIEDEKIPVADRNSLYAIQRKAREKDLGANPSVSRALKVAGHMLDRTLKDPNSTSGRQFRGALQEILEEEVAANKGVPLKDERIKEIVSQLLQGQPGTGWLFDNPRYQYFRQPSADDLVQLKNMYPWMNEEQLTDKYTEAKWHTFSKEYEEAQKLGKAAQQPAKGAPAGGRTGGAAVPTSR